MINNLPKKYHFSHDYALFLHDILAAIITQGESADVFTHTIELTDQKHADILDKMPDDDRWDWLEANGYSQHIHGVISRHVIAALLSDFCHFVFEALSCSRKSKLTVAYSLLRKPFKDNLFYLEWLLAEPTVFINTFQHGGPEKLEDHRSKQHLRLPIIKKAVSKTSTPGMFNAEFIDEIRYDRKVGYGFAAPWDQANHLLTTFSAVRTTDQSFNFVFLDPTDEARWEFLYVQLPMLLYYAIEVVEALLIPLVPRPEKLKDNTYYRRAVGFTLWTESLGMEDVSQEEDALDLPDCPDCGGRVKWDKANSLLFYNELKIMCPSCGKVGDMSQEIEEPAQ